MITQTDHLTMWIPPKLTPSEELEYHDLEYICLHYNDSWCAQRFVSLNDKLKYTVTFISGNDVKWGLSP